MSAMASGVWNDHVTGVVTWAWKVKVVSSWPRYIWMQISWKWFKIETRYHWITNRKGHVANRLVTSPMTSRDGHVTGDATWHRKVKWWPQYVCGLLSRQWLEIETQLQWSTYRKWLPGVSNGQVTGDVTYLERSRSLPRYISMQVSRKRLRIEARFQWDTIGNNILLVEWSCNRWCHVTMQGQVREPRSCPLS